MEARATIREDGEAGATGAAVRVPWWSFSKTVLAVALLRLSQQGRVSLDKTVEDKPYTPSQLLRHEAGLPDYGSLPRYHADVEAGRSPWSVDDLWNETAADRLRYEPGRGWAYSNIGYMMVGRLIQQASDRPLADALADLVFVRAELATARLAVAPSDLADVQMGDAVGYHPGWVYHGLVVGTAMDAARLLRRLVSGNLLGPDLLSGMLDPRSLPQVRSKLHPDPAYGLGLMLNATMPLRHPIGHSGSGPGSRIAVYAQQETTCVVWATTASGLDPEAEILRSLRNGGI